MESCVIAAIYLNYEEALMKQHVDSTYLLGEIKLLLLSPNKIRPYFQLPMIRMLTKHNKIESIRDGIRKTFRVKSKVVLKMVQVNMYIDKLESKTKSLLMIVFLDCPGYKDHIDRSEFIYVSELDNTPMGEQSMDYLSAVKKWIKAESIDPQSLLAWFRPCKRGEAHHYKSNRAILDSSLERVPFTSNTELLYKSTSLETLARPVSVNNVTHSRKQADSLDRISEQDLTCSSMELKNAIKSKITKSRVLSSANGPISAVPLQERASVSDCVVLNPLMHSHIEFRWQSDMVVCNPFWKQHKQLDRSQIGVHSKSVFVKENNVWRNKQWSLEYPLHFAAYKGDMLLVSSLIENGCDCPQRDQSGWTPMHYAVWYGHFDIVSLFLTFQLISVNCTTTTASLTPLHLALFNRQSSISQLLLKQPDLDISLKTSFGEDARCVAEKYDKQLLVPLIKFVCPKLSRIQVTLMDNSTRTLLLTRGPDTTFQQLRLQMIEILNLPSNSFDVFNFWIGYRIPKYTGKNSLVPCECFGPSSMPLKDLDPLDMKLYWKRNIFLSLDKERKVKHATVLSLLFGEAACNFTKKSRYPCDSTDVSLLSSVLLSRHLQSSNSSNVNSSNVIANQRALSLNRINRPLSFVLGSKLNGQARQMSASMQTLKDRPKYRYTTSSFNDLSERAPIIDQLSRQAMIFLSSYKNLALILPKQKLKNSKINWSDDIVRRFLQSPLSYKNCTLQEKEYRFLTLCWNLTLYGCAYFTVEIKFNSSIPFTECMLAVNDMGVYFLHTRTKNVIQNFKYSSITWYPSSTDKCLLLFAKRNNIYIKTKQSVMISDLMLKLHSVNLRN